MLKLPTFKSFTGFSFETFFCFFFFFIKNYRQIPTRFETAATRVVVQKLLRPLVRSPYLLRARVQRTFDYRRNSQCCAAIRALIVRIKHVCANVVGNTNVATRRWNRWEKRQNQIVFVSSITTHGTRARVVITISIQTHNIYSKYLDNHLMQKFSKCRAQLFGKAYRVAGGRGCKHFKNQHCLGRTEKYL